MFVANIKEIINDERIFNLDFFIDIITHENIHREQNNRSKIEYKLPNPNDKKKYFSDKNEIMAFSYTIAKSLYDNNNTLEGALKALSKRDYDIGINARLWIDILKKSDDETIKRYNKYIYLYLQELYKEDEE